MAAGPDLGVGVEGQRRVVDLERRELVAQLAQELDVDDELLVAGHEPALQPAGRVHDEVRPGEERRQERHQRLVRGLGVDGLRRVEAAAAAPGQSEAPRDLTGAEHAHPRLRRAERRRARLHVGVTQKRSEHDGAAGADQLRQRDAGERLGDLLDERRRQRHRRHRAHQQERSDDHGLVGFHVLEHRREHAVVVAERRVHVDEADRDRRALDRLAAAEQDLAHPDRVGGIRAARHRSHVGLVGQGLKREHHVEVARVQRPVLGLADRAAGRVELGEGLGEADEVLEVGHLRVAADVALADEGAAVDRREHHVVPADVRGVGGIAGLELELARRLGDLLEDELGVEADAVLVLDDLARFLQQVHCLGEQELDPDLGYEPPPAAIDHGHRVFAEDLVAGHGVDEQGGSSRFGVFSAAPDGGAFWDGGAFGGG